MNWSKLWKEPSIRMALVYIIGGYVILTFVFAEVILNILTGIPKITDGLLVLSELALGLGVWCLCQIGGLFWIVNFILHRIKTMENKEESA